MPRDTVGLRRTDHGTCTAHRCDRPPFCGHHEQPGVTRIREALDWTHQETTRDQAHIEAVLETLAIMGTSLLHVGVGNSQLAQRFASRARHIDGLTVHPHEKTYADALGLSNYTVYVLNKYSPAFDAVLTQPYDFIIDNNLASFACCHAHFSGMLAQYLRALTAHGQILTCQIGMDAYQDDCGWSLSYADLVRLERQFPMHVSKLTALVYAIAVRP